MELRELKALKDTLDARMEKAESDVARYKKRIGEIETEMREMLERYEDIKKELGL